MISPGIGRDHLTPKRQPGEDLWTPKRLAEYLGVSKSLVYSWAADGTLPAILLAEGARKRTYRFDPAQIAEWVRTRTNRKIPA